MQGITNVIISVQIILQKKKTGKVTGNLRSFSLHEYFQFLSSLIAKNQIPDCQVGRSSSYIDHSHSSILQLN
jgi:hypothetical protein